MKCEELQKNWTLRKESEVNSTSSYLSWIHGSNGCFYLPMALYLPNACHGPRVEKKCWKGEEKKSKVL